MTRTLDFETLTLASGAHDADSGQMCVMEAVAWLAGESWTDAPQCASPVIAAFCRAWNDTPDPDGAAIRARLVRYIPRLVGSRGTPEQEERRAWMALDWLIRVHTPAWLRLAGLIEHAEALAGLEPQTSQEALDRSAAASAAAWDAARAAAWDAAWDAARAAAWDAAWDAASAAAWDAAWDAASAAAWDAAWDAARAAATEALGQTVAELQVSAWRLLDELLAVTETSENKRSGE